MSAKKNENAREPEFAIPTENYKYLIITFVIIIVGFLLMIGGKSEDPNVFNHEMFNAQRTILAPIIVVFGFAFGIWAIMKKPKNTDIK
jgi:hypothetical protein